eukprot:NODE_19995_length_818_cov_7.960926.p2 GENE.NODE_19995_length_818_cov_7.960926~~NODE_19995_length_818_cov_7.960926.p2  ORF type:complete len:170 (+),score=49.77 NODE_19995_length_818_cov_7.960926:135-644(+)
MAFAASSLEQMGVPLPDAVRALINGQSTGSSFYNDAMGFYHAVSWAKDRWIFGVFALQALVLLVVLLQRRRLAVLGTVFLLNAVVLGLAERINGLGRTHWRSFSTQMYFDEGGVFVGVILCAPLLLMQLAILVCLLVDASRLLVTVKRAEIRSNLKKKREAAAKEGKAD